MQHEETLIADEQVVVTDQPETIQVVEPEEKTVKEKFEDAKAKRREYAKAYYHKQRSNKKKFDKSAYMKKYHAKKRAEKLKAVKTKEVVSTPKQSSNGHLMNVITAYQTLYNHTNKWETKQKLNQALSAIVVEMA